MVITSNSLVNAVALTEGIDITPTLLDAWGQGCVELYYAIGEWAMIVTTEEDHLAQALSDTSDSWPGVFAYEVTEDVGAEIRNAILLGDMPSDDRVRQAVRNSVLRFIGRGTNPETAHAYMSRSL